MFTTLLIFTINLLIFHQVFFIYNKSLPSPLFFQPFAYLFAFLLVLPAWGRPGFSTPFKSTFTFYPIHPPPTHTHLNIGVPHGRLVGILDAGVELVVERVGPSVDGD